MIRPTDIHPITEFQRRAKTYIQQVTTTKNPIAVTINGTAQVVVQDAATYQSMIEELEQRRGEATQGTRASAIGVQAKLRRWQQGTATQTTLPASAQELFRQWDAEDVALTEDERQAETQLWDEVERGINENRAALGMRRL